MTCQSAMEEIHELFPNITDTAIYRDLDSAQKKFVNATKLLTARGACSDVSTNFGWNLPSDCIEVYDFKAYNSSGEPVYFGVEQLNWEVEFDKIYLYSLTSTPISVTPSGISSLYVHYRKDPSTVTTSASTFTVNEKYHKGIVADVLSEYFAKYPTLMIQGSMMRDFNAAKYWQTIYNQHRIEAKKDAGNAQYSHGGDPVNYPFGGKFELPLREYDSSVSSTLSGLSSMYANFCIFTAEEGDSAGTILGQTGYAGTLAVAISTNTITLTSTSSEFDQYVQVISSNGDINWIRTSATTITLTAYTGWSKTKVQVYELPV